MKIQKKIHDSLNVHEIHKYNNQSYQSHGNGTGQCGCCTRKYYVSSGGWSGMLGTNQGDINTCKSIFINGDIIMLDETNEHIIRALFNDKIFISDNIFVNISSFKHHPHWKHISTIQCDDWDKITQIGFYKTLKVDSKYVIREYTDACELYKII